MIRKNIFETLFPTLILLLLFSCQTRKNNISEKPGSSITLQEAVAKWQDQKYSMFIHFGVYSKLGGVWDGHKVEKGYSEQIRAHGNIPKEEYRKVANTFNPVNWNPDSIAVLAKKAGMKSIVITAKHHDGFALFDTKYSDFDIIDATPYKHDIIKELAEATRKQGLDFGVYFSLIDWNYEYAMPISPHNSDSIPPQHHQFNLNQVEELMTHYGPISEIWFDMGRPTLQQSKELVEMVKKHQPNTLVSGRIWNDQGDFAVMGDNVSPDFRMGTIWQTPASMFSETWGYRSWQERRDPHQKALEKLTSLIKVVNNGGKYLLNIGPKGDGSVVPFEKEVLLTIGEWLDKNGEAIYGTSTSPLFEQSWGTVTAKPGKQFLFLLNPPVNGQLIIKNLRTRPKHAYLVSDPSVSFPVNQSGNEYSIDISELPPTNLINVIGVKYDGKLDYIPAKTVEKSDDGSYSLTSENAINYHSLSGKEYYSTKPTVVRKKWFIINPQKEKFALQLLYTTNEVGKEIQILINGNPIEVLLDKEPDNDSDGHINKGLSDIDLKKGEINKIEIGHTDQSNPHKDLGVDGLIIELK